MTDLKDFQENLLRCLGGEWPEPCPLAPQMEDSIARVGYRIEFIPGLNQYGDTPDIVALIAPRPLHLSFGTQDRHSPISDVKIAMGTIEKAYENCQQSFTYFIEEKQGHILSEQMWEHVRAKFLKYLPPN